jgi:succinoglycan biosynthesis transport protein ExoP
LQREIIESQQNQLDAQVDPDNPAYISLRAALDTLDAQEYSLKEEESNLRIDLAEYERRLMVTPQIEKEMAAMGRTLSSTSNRYWVMRDKQFATEMGETLEEENKGESMLLIEPPRVPLKPYKPNRSAIIILAFLFAVVAGIGVTQLADALDKSIREAGAIISVQGVPPIVEVPYIYTEEELAHTAKIRRMALGSSPVLLIAAALVVHFTLMPLDVLWYSLASRVGF